ncbi:uncharacterized protein LOC128993468 [Macrosteles quadrilineatus]|uniref:uncharacterized protein LOC128993468 n=1 Tax=Macrosteles quadrilineatus TaxID=74068 RepID=UPI0023E202B9|nr:uncharacterized protein LOC128993468 [Macrosteles quadrilineatus]
MPNNTRSGYIFKNNRCYREMSEKKNGTQTDLREQRKSAAAFLGTLAIMITVISLYTLYAVALNDTLTVLRYPFPVVFVARMPPSPEEGTSEEKTLKIEAK